MSGLSKTDSHVAIIEMSVISSQEDITQDDQASGRKTGTGLDAQEAVSFVMFADHIRASGDSDKIIAKFELNRREDFSDFISISDSFFNAEGLEDKGEDWLADNDSRSTRIEHDNEAANGVIFIETVSDSEAFDFDVPIAVISHGEISERTNVVLGVNTTEDEGRAVGGHI